MNVPLLSVRDLNVRYDLPRGNHLDAVRDVSLTLDAGDRVGLVGESGCGKSTCLLALMGLLPSTASVSGSVELAGQEILAGGERTMRSHRWKDVAMVFQGAMNALNPVQTIGAQIAEPMKLHRIAGGAEARERAAELLRKVGITPDRAGDYPHQLSGGMRQRAAIAMAISCQPRVLLADEPTTALDVMVQAQVLELLDTLASQLGLALVMVTHDLPLVSQIATRAAVMYAGRIVEEATVEDLYHRPRHPYTKLLYQAVPSLDEFADVVSIPGSPPRLDLPINACPFEPRCPSAFAPCSVAAPLLVGTERRRVACHLHDLAAEQVR